MRIGEVVLDVVDDPAGRRAVLLQFGEAGWVTLLPDDARRVAAEIVDMAREAES